MGLVHKALEREGKNERIHYVWTDPSDRVGLIFREHTPGKKTSEGPCISAHLFDGGKEVEVMRIDTQHIDQKRLSFDRFNYSDQTNLDPDEEDYRTELQSILGGLGFGDLMLNILESSALLLHRKGTTDRIVGMPTKSAQDRGLYLKRGWTPWKGDSASNSMEGISHLQLVLSDFEKKRERILTEDPEKLRKFTVPPKFGNLYIPLRVHPKGEGLIHFSPQSTYPPRQIEGRVNMMLDYIKRQSKVPKPARRPP